MQTALKEWSTDRCLNRCTVKSFHLGIMIFIMTFKWLMQSKEKKETSVFVIRVIMTFPLY